MNQYSESGYGGQRRRSIKRTLEDVDNDDYDIDDGYENYHSSNRNGGRRNNFGPPIEDYRFPTHFRNGQWDGGGTRSASVDKRNWKRKKRENEEKAKSFENLRKRLDASKLDRENYAWVEDKYDVKRWMRRPVENGGMETVKKDQKTGETVKGVVFQMLTEEVFYEGKNKTPIIRFFGTTPKGNSVTCNVRGFKPYFYCDAVHGKTGERVDKDELLSEVNHYVLQRLMEYEKKADCFVEKLEWMEKVSFQDYQGGTNVDKSGEKKIEVYKVTCSSPKFVERIRSCMEEELGLRTYESNVRFILRGMIDMNITGGSWIVAPEGKCKLLIGEHKEKKTFSQIEIDIDYRELVSLGYHGEWSKYAPFRVLSFDIECVSHNGRTFPDPKNLGDQVIQIGNNLYENGKLVERNVFVVGSTVADKVIEQYCFTDEKTLLCNWWRYVHLTDPDIVTGFNITKFDITYILGRSKALDIPLASLLGRVKQKQSTSRKTQFSSKQAGTNETCDIEMHGRWVLDVLNHHIKKNRKWSSYTLNNAAKQELGEQKEDVHHSQIYYLHNGTEHTRKRLGIYCEKDARLSWRLLEKMCVIPDHIEMARASGTPVSYVGTKGQSIAVQTLLLKKLRTTNYIVPFYDSGWVSKELERMEEEAKKKKTEEKEKKNKKVRMSSAYGIDFKRLFGAAIAREFCDPEEEEEDMDRYEGDYDDEVRKLQYVGRYEGDYLVDRHGVKWYKIGKEYAGGHVHPPAPGFYDEPITVLDFASLYPSIMKDNNLCPTTKIPPSAAANMDAKLYNKFDIVDKNKVVVASHYFAKQEVKTGILPQILTDLLTARSVAKKEMAAAEKTDPDLYTVLNQRQNNLKVRANSVYGFTGANVGKFPCKEIAETVTQIGQNMIKSTKEKIEKKFTVENGYKEDADVIYGDSVVADTPVLLRKNGSEVEIKTIDAIANPSNSSGCPCEEELDAWEPYDEFKPLEKNLRNKEQYKPDGYEVWTSKGWSKIRRVIRHKTDKRIYEVLTHTGFVRVTEDHSLLDSELRQVKPKDVSVGNRLYHSFPNEFDDNNTMGNGMTKEKAYIYGFFFGDGSCGKYGEKEKTKYSWALNSNDMQLCVKLKDLCESIYGKTFKVLDTLKSSAVYKIVPSHGDIKSYVNEYRGVFYDKRKNKIVPKNILNGTKEIRKSFLDGYYEADGSIKERREKGCNRVDVKSQISAMSLYYLVSSLGYNVSVNNRKDKPDIFRCTFSKQKFRKKADTIKKIRRMNNPFEYVYDLETECGNFHAGVGRMIVKNTDSVMVRFKHNSIEETCKLGREAAKFISSEFINDFISRRNDDAKDAKAAGIITELQFEKVYFPYLLITKKRYAGKHIEAEFDKDGKVKLKHKGIKSRGMENVRRDNCPLVRKTQDACLGHFMKDTKEEIQKGIGEAKKFLSEIVGRLYAGEIDYSDLIISKTISKKGYKNKQPHTELAKILEERLNRGDPTGMKPVAGDRVSYIMVKRKKKDEKAFEKAEDPWYAMENGIRPDAEYYLESQLKNPMIRMFYHLIPKKMMTVKSANSNEKEKVVEDLAWKKEELEKLFKLKGKKVDRIPDNCQFYNYGFEKIEKCAKCNKSLKQFNGVKMCHTEWCEMYLEKGKEVVKSKMELLMKKRDEEFNKCYKCQDTKEIICSARDCPVFYKKKTIEKDIRELSKTSPYKNLVVKSAK